MKVELIEVPSEINEASIKQYLADCSSVVRIKQPKDNDRLYDRLLKESYGNKPSRVFEFLPCIISNRIVARAVNQYFGFRLGDMYYTTARELLNWGWRLEDVIAVVNFTDYRAVKVEAPYFLYGQASTHNQVTSVSHSNRYTEADLGYWFPIEFPTWYNPSEHGDMDLQEYWDYCVKNITPNHLQDFMKDTLNVKRREVFARGSDMLQNRVYTLGAFTNNPNAWEHFVNQRLVDKHTQLEMRELTQLIKDKIYG